MTNRRAVGMLTIAVIVAAGGLFVAAFNTRLRTNLAMHELMTGLNDSAIDVRHLLPACSINTRTSPVSRRSTFSSLELSPAMRGLALWLAGQCDEALRTWEEIYANNSQPDSFTVKQSVLFLIRAYAGSGQWNEVPPYVEIFDFPRLAASLGKSALAEGDIEQAAHWYNTQLEVSPSFEDSERLVEILTQLHRSTDALDVWQRTVQTIPEPNLDHWLAKARLGQIQENCKATLQALEQALTIDPKRTTTLMDLALNNRSCGDPLAAARWYKMATDLSPQNEYIWAHVGIAYYEAGEWEQAREYLLHSLEVKPNPFAYDYLSRLAEHSGDWEQALHWQKLTTELAPSGIAYLRLGDIYVAAGRVNDGRAAYQQSLVLQPQDNLALERLSKLTSMDQKP
jgi:tetratricopeptide (TPR) repeat protein